jgi:hypothetical protein
VAIAYDERLLRAFAAAGVATAAPS